MKKLILLSVIALVSIQSCTKKPDRYVVLGTGEIPVFLDTETNEVFSVDAFHENAPTIYKTHLSKASDR